MRTFKKIPLSSIALIHPINRPTALSKIADRVAIINAHKDELFSSEGYISNELLERLMPSVSPIQIISFQGGYMSFEGNGRVLALQRAFAEGNVMVEVEEFAISPDSSIYKDIESLQKIYKE